MLYLSVGNKIHKYSDILIIDLTFNFCELSVRLFARKCALEVSLKLLIVIFRFFCVTETRHFNVLSLLFVVSLF